MRIFEKYGPKNTFNTLNNSIKIYMYMAGHFLQLPIASNHRIFVSITVLTINQNFNSPTPPACFTVSGEPELSSQMQPVVAPATPG
jgi:hypothetical protein